MIIIVHLGRLIGNGLHTVSSKRTSSSSSTDPSPEKLRRSSFMIFNPESRRCSINHCLLNTSYLVYFNKSPFPLYLLNICSIFFEYLLNICWIVEYLERRQNSSRLAFPINPCQPLSQRCSC